VHFGLRLLPLGADGPLPASLARLHDVVRPDARAASLPDRVEQLVEALDVDAAVRVEALQSEQRVKAVEDREPRLRRRDSFDEPGDELGGERLVGENVGEEPRGRVVLDAEAAEPLEQVASADVVRIDPERAAALAELGRNRGDGEPRLARLGLAAQEVILARVEECGDLGRRGRPSSERDDVEWLPRGRGDEVGDEVVDASFSPRQARSSASVQPVGRFPSRHSQ